MGKATKKKQEEISNLRDKQALILSSKPPLSRRKKRLEKPFLDLGKYYFYAHEQQLFEEFHNPENVRHMARNYSIRKYSNFKPKHRDKNKKLIGIINHVFCRYPIPRFMYEAWTSNSSSVPYRSLFIFWTQGKSLYENYTNQFMTRAETHNFQIHSNPNLSISQNIWRAKMESRKMPVEMQNIILDNEFVNIIGHCENIQFWDQVLNFFAKHSVDKDTFQDIFDFLRDTRRNNPDFSLKGRTLKSVINIVNAWEIQLQREGINSKRLNKADLSWEGMTIPIFTQEEDVVHKSGNQKIITHITWTVEEILSERGLLIEGAKMHHCVGSYAKNCYEGYTSIFRMLSKDELEDTTPKRHLTIEVSRHSNKVVQARGPCNSKIIPGSQQEKILNSFKEFLLHNYNSIAGI